VALDTGHRSSIQVGLPLKHGTFANRATRVMGHVTPNSRHQIVSVQFHRTYGRYTGLLHTAREHKDANISRVEL
jgi:hypothetical protein